MDRDSCPFYRKIGTCRHGNACSKKHTRPRASNTLLCQNMYQGQEFDDFVEDMFCAAGQIAPISDILVSSNTNEHLRGNLYLAFDTTADAQRVMDNLNTRWYDGRPVVCDLSPVHDLRTACCRQAETSECDRGSLCNYVHPVAIRPALLQRLYASQEKTWQH